MLTITIKPLQHKQFSLSLFFRWRAIIQSRVLALYPYPQPWGCLEPWEPQHWLGSGRGPASRPHTDCSRSSHLLSGQTGGRRLWILDRERVWGGGGQDSINIRDKYGKGCVWVHKVKKERGDDKIQRAKKIKIKNKEKRRLIPIKMIVLLGHVKKKTKKKKRHAFHKSQ